MDRIFLFTEPLQRRVAVRVKKGVVYFSADIFSSPCMPEQVKKYVESRENYTFRPHATTFHIEGTDKVRLLQRVPLHCGFRPTMRQQVYDFFRLANGCHRILADIALDE